MNFASKSFTRFNLLQVDSTGRSPLLKLLGIAGRNVLPPLAIVGRVSLRNIGFENAKADEDVEDGLRMHRKNGKSVHKSNERRKTLRQKLNVVGNAIPMGKRKKVYQKFASDIDVREHLPAIEGDRIGRDRVKYSSKGENNRKDNSLVCKDECKANTRPIGGNSMGDNCSFLQYPDVPSFCIDEDYNKYVTGEAKLIVQSSRKIFKSPLKMISLPPKELAIHTAYRYYMKNTNPLERFKLTNSIFNTPLNEQWLEDKDLIMKTIKDCSPQTEQLLKLPQICVCGRSNVGKSSLLNSLIGKKFDAFQVSSLPGKTRYLKFLQIGYYLAIVDMPGYGYGRISKVEAKEVENRIAEYLVSSFPRRAYILLDARRGLSDSDRVLIDKLEAIGLTYTLVLTKCDKVDSKTVSNLECELRQWVSERVHALDGIMITSSKDGIGIDQLRSSIYLACELNLKDH